ncbi:MAG: hypothetical protein IPK66_06995 [Rhodospirillales bacterium]|nr:hypothetical protein [Rhodospirillales bacterium]
MSTAVVLSGCSVIDPKYFPPRPGSDPEQKQFNAAVARSNDLFTTYADGRSEMRLYALATGVTLYGLVVAGLGLALFQAPNNALLGVGLAGAGIGGLRALLPFDSRQKAYASGQKAISCSVLALSLGETGVAGVVEPPKVGVATGAGPAGGDLQTTGSDEKKTEGALMLASAPRRTSYESDLIRLKADLDKIRSEIATSGSSGQREAAVVRRESAIDETIGGLAASVADLADSVSPSKTDGERAQLLDAALMAIDLAVQDQLDAAEVDPDKATKAAGGAVAPFLTTLAENVTLARAQTRRLRNEAAATSIVASDKQQAATKQGGTEAAQVTREAAEMNADAGKAQEAAAIADPALNKIWGLIRLPNECLGGFAAGAQGGGQTASTPGS